MTQESPDYVGTKRWVRPPTPYEEYMEAQGVPIHRGAIGYYDLRDLTLGPWKRWRRTSRQCDDPEICLLLWQ
jgi:hypothetical protein